MTIADLDVSC